MMKLTYIFQDWRLAYVKYKVGVEGKKNCEQGVAGSSERAGVDGEKESRRLRQRREISS